jgi:hypothetical protein
MALSNLFKKRGDSDSPKSPKKSNTQTAEGSLLGVLNIILIILLISGIIIVLIFGANSSGRATIFMWMLACLLSGTFVGFLFGIPKVVQNQENSNNKSSASNINTSSNNNNNSGLGYQQQVNSNLVEISDWLTKIIVGLGLVKLTKIPPYLSQVANILATGLNQTTTQPAGLAVAFSYGVIIGYSTMGFLFGYITTRVYLAGAFSAADQNALKRIADKAEETEGKAQSALQKAEFALTTPRSFTQQGNETAEATLQQLILDYNQTRSKLPSGGLRTSKMTEIIKAMVNAAFSIVAFDISAALMSQDNGIRLSGYAYLYARPDHQYLDQLSNAIIKDPTPFGQYWGIQALGKIINDQAITQLDPAIFNKLKAFYDQLAKGIDREYELRKILHL